MDNEIRLWRFRKILWTYMIRESRFGERDHMAILDLQSLDL